MILGSGWAGYNLSRSLKSSKYQTVVVSPRSHFAFTPLLASTSVGTLEFRTALEPIRSRNRATKLFQGWADDVDFENKRISVEEAVENSEPGASLKDDPVDTTEVCNRSQGMGRGQAFDMAYDKLIIAVGCYNQTFNTKGVKENAYFLKDVGDARRIRNRILACFERAALPTTSETTKKQLLNFAVVGGGPTGIEWSAELHDLIHDDLRKLYPELAPLAKITVYDVADHVLGMFDSKLSEYAIKTFARQGISIQTSHHVVELRPGSPDNNVRSSEDDTSGVYTLETKEDGKMGVGMCVWSTGLMMNPFIATALCDRVKRHERSGGLVTNEHLQVKAADGSVIPGVYAIGDCATLEGTSYPKTGQVANQLATLLGKHLNKGDVETAGFKYRDLGIMAYIGNWNAVVDSKGGRYSGRMAWFIWRTVYLAKSVSWRNRILIPTYWSVSRSVAIRSVRIS